MMFGEKLSAFEWRWHLFWIIRNFAHSRLKENDKSLYGFASMSIRCAVPHRNDAKWKQKLVWRLLSFVKTRSLRFRSSTWPWSRFTLSQPLGRSFFPPPFSTLGDSKKRFDTFMLDKERLNKFLSTGAQDPPSIILHLKHNSVENNLKNRKRLQIHSTTKVKRLAHWKLESKGPTTAASTHEDLKRTHKRSCERSIKIALWIEERERQKSIVIIIISVRLTSKALTLKQNTRKWITWKIIFPLLFLAHSLFTPKRNEEKRIKFSTRTNERASHTQHFHTRKIYIISRSSSRSQWLCK